jgi:hypothetical protein
MRTPLELVAPAEAAANTSIANPNTEADTNRLIVIEQEAITRALARTEIAAAVA